MKVLQLIDSLEAGGAERMAVNIANGLAKRISGSYLCATRSEGTLKTHLDNKVGYLFLKRRSTLDVNAVIRLHRFITSEKIDVIHAHSSSFFLGTLIRVLHPKITLIWQDHYGNSEYLATRPKRALKYCSRFFSHVVCVNRNLEQWNRDVLGVKDVSYVSNFTNLEKTMPVTVLKGQEGKRLICLANLRPQKDHITLLKAFKNIVKKDETWTLHCIGQDFGDAYGQLVKSFIKAHGLENHVFLYGSCSDTNHILSQGTVGVLSSKSEGLPLALLEYGMAELPVVATHVGDCSLVISNKETGLLVAPENEKSLENALLTLLEDASLRHLLAQSLKARVMGNFSESSSINKLLKVYKQ